MRVHIYLDGHDAKVDVIYGAFCDNLLADIVCRLTAKEKNMYMANIYIYLTRLPCEKKSLAMSPPHGEVCYRKEGHWQ